MCAKTLPAGEEYRKDLQYLLQQQRAIDESLENEVAFWGGKKMDDTHLSFEILGENITVK